VGFRHAAVTDRCLHGAGEIGGFAESLNEPYYNFGCATQRNLASSVANPEDLVQTRAETPAFAGRRQTVMEKYARGQDTASQASAAPTTGKASNVGP
jgi:pilus assembly protein CpaD